MLIDVRENWSAAESAPTLREAGDRAAQRFASQLADARPDDAVLSEEAADDPGRLTADRVWIIDPLDGTREFAEGRPTGPCTSPSGTTASLPPVRFHYRP